MRTLLIMRHAKSSWLDPGLSDFDRPLNDRGEHTAPLMGELMRREGLIPDLILSSPATRAKTTAEAVRSAARFTAEITFESDIYEASSNALRKLVARSPADQAVVMMVGHNPGMEGLIYFLTNASESMPTCALAVIDLEIDDWADIRQSCGNIRRIYRPKIDLA